MKLSQFVSRGWAGGGWGVGVGRGRWVYPGCSQVIRCTVSHHLQNLGYLANRPGPDTTHVTFVDLLLGITQNNHRKVKTERIHHIISNIFKNTNSFLPFFIIIIIFF